MFIILLFLRQEAESDAEADVVCDRQRESSNNSDIRNCDCLDDRLASLSATHTGNAQCSTILSTADTARLGFLFTLAGSLAS